jgi:predicted nucleic acid-binding protein
LLTDGLDIRWIQGTIVVVEIVADTNTFLAVALDEPERAGIVQLTIGHDLVAPEVLPFEIGNALTALMKRGVLQGGEVGAVWDVVQAIPVDLRAVDIKEALGIAVRFGMYAYDAYL